MIDIVCRDQANLDWNSDIKTMSPQAISNRVIHVFVQMELHDELPLQDTLK